MLCPECIATLFLECLLVETHNTADERGFEMGIA
jgi:hypothetical protein